MAAAGTYGSFELAGLFASSLQRKSSDASIIDSRGTALVTQAQFTVYIVKAAPEAREWQETGD